MVTNPTQNKDVFRFVCPADLEKAADGSYRIRGLASTERVDQQGETIIQKGVDLTPIDKKRGVLNWDHMKGPENTIGVLDGYQRTAKGLFIEGRLFKNHSKAKAVREIMDSLGDSDKGRIGLSVEGKILERDPSNPAIIRKCQISAVALTMNPVNTETFADIVKSMNGAQEVEFDAQEQNIIDSTDDQPVFTASQVMAIVQKALGIGAGATGVPDAKTGGDALSPSDMKPKKKKKNEMEKGEEDADGSSFSSKPMEVVKGGPGSGSKGHKTLHNKEAYHNIAWDAQDHGSDLDHKHYSHLPKHLHQHVQNIKDAADVHHETDEDHPKYGEAEKKLGDATHAYQQAVDAHFKKKPMKKMAKNMYKSNLINILDKLQVLYPNHSRSEIWEAVKERLDTKFDMEKGIRLKNTSGKEREHKLYEDARQRDDYERNKDKSRAELNQLAQESGASKHDKEKIRAQRDAAIQAGEDRGHVRPNVKG